MLPEHYIEWVALQTRQGNQRKVLHPGDKPEVRFALCEGDRVEAYMTYNMAYGDKTYLYFIPKESPVAVFFSVDKVE